MSVIPVEPFLMSDCVLKVAADDFAAHCSKVELVPSSSVVNWGGLKSSAQFSFPTKAKWACGIDYAQDWTTDGSLSRYLHDHEGESVDAEFVPKNGGPSVLATLIITPGSIGGALDGVATASVSLGVSGKPEFVDA